jgi:uncharacterized membrane protein YjgN (DUF898 family)
MAEARVQPAESSTAASNSRAGSDHSTSFPQPAPPDLAPPPAMATMGDRPRPRPRTLSFSFTGSATEYFGIWIVNILLKIVTCGIYSAWAKVRMRRYFYGNTLVDGSPFGYLADPLALFRGWLIGAALFIVYMVGTNVSPSLSFIFVLIIFSVTPWLIVRSRMFNQRNTEHRGIRFRFRPNYREAYLVFAGLPLLMPMTLGLLLPYMVYRQKRFFVENSSYGQTACTFTATAEDYYRTFVKALGVFILILGICGALLFAVSATFFSGINLLNFSHAGTGAAALQKSALIAIVVLFFLAVPLYLTFAVYLETALFNLSWNGSGIGDNRFRSSLTTASILGIRITNALAIFFSLGLLIPWAAVRITRYRIGQLALETTGDVHLFVAAPDEEIGPVGEEIGDIFGIDVAL